MGLIKSISTPELSPFSMKDVERQAAALMARARQRAEQMLAAAQEEGRRLAADAIADGFAKGRVDGEKAGRDDGHAAGKTAALAEQREKLEGVLKALSGLVTQFQAARNDLEAAACTEVIKLAVAIARRVTKLQGALDPAVVTENVRAAVKLVSANASVQLSINPAQRQILDQLLPQLKMSWPNVSHVELCDDETLAPGGCKVASGHGQIDADLDRQIDRIVSDLLPATAS